MNAFPRVFGGFRASLRRSFSGQGGVRLRGGMDGRSWRPPGESLLARPLNFAMTAEERPELTMIERIERALVLLAYFIELDGDVHVAIYEKFEAELEELKKKDHVDEWDG